MPFEKDHKIFVHFCSPHPYGTTIPSIVQNDFVQTKCYCKKELYSIMCKFCIQVRYNLNFRCRNLPDFLKLKLFSDYLKQLDCEPCLYFDGNLVRTSLDNLEMDKVPSQIDSRPILHRSLEKND